MSGEQIIARNTFGGISVIENPPIQTGSIPTTPVIPQQPVPYGTDYTTVPPTTVNYTGIGYNVTPTPIQQPIPVQPTPTQPKQPFDYPQNIDLNNINIPKDITLARNVNDIVAASARSVINRDRRVFRKNPLSRDVNEIFKDPSYWRRTDYRRAVQNPFRNNLTNYFQRNVQSMDYLQQDVLNKMFTRPLNIEKLNIPSYNVDNPFIKEDFGKLNNIYTSTIDDISTNNIYTPEISSDSSSIQTPVSSYANLNQDVLLPSNLNAEVTPKSIEKISPRASRIEREKESRTQTGLMNILKEIKNLNKSQLKELSKISATLLDFIKINPFANAQQEASPGRPKTSGSGDKFISRPNINQDRDNEEEGGGSLLNLVKGAIAIGAISYGSHLNRDSYGSGGGKGFGGDVSKYTSDNVKLKKLKVTQKELNDRAMRAMKYLINKHGMSKERAAGMVGNGLIESNLDPQNINKIGMQGIFQWDTSRRNRFKEKYGFPLIEATMEQQLDYAVWELGHTHKSAGKNLEKQTSAKGSSIAFEAGFEIDETVQAGGFQQSRVDEAEKALELYNKQEGQQTQQEDPNKNNIVQSSIKSKVEQKEQKTEKTKPTEKLDSINAEKERLKRVHHDIENIQTAISKTIIEKTRNGGENYDTVLNQLYEQRRDLYKQLEPKKYSFWFDKRDYLTDIKDFSEQTAVPYAKWLGKNIYHNITKDRDTDRDQRFEKPTAENQQKEKGVFDKLYDVGDAVGGVLKRGYQQDVDFIMGTKQKASDISEGVGALVAGVKQLSDFVEKNKESIGDMKDFLSKMSTQNNQSILDLKDFLTKIAQNLQDGKGGVSGNAPAASAKDPDITESPAYVAGD